MNTVTYNSHATAYRFACESYGRDAQNYRAEYPHLGINSRSTLIREQIPPDPSLSPATARITEYTGYSLFPRFSFPFFVLFFLSSFSAFFLFFIMSGVPAVYYHGTGSENAGRAYTEAPMQHVQRNALRKKCMKSTFTLLEKYAPKHLLLYSFSVCLSFTCAHAHTHIYIYIQIDKYINTYTLAYFFHHSSVLLAILGTEVPRDARSLEVQPASPGASSLRIVPPRLSRFVQFLPPSVP